jgi:uncharacterized phage-associated protein
MISAKQGAEYLLSLTEPDADENLSHLKLQKLLYYAQGISLAVHGCPLFGERIVRWMHGPVVAELYHELKHYGSNGIPCPENIDFSLYDEAQRDVLHEAFKVYGQFSAWKLREMTHSEPPWNSVADGQEIPIAAIEAYFKTLIT